MAEGKQSKEFKYDNSFQFIALNMSALMNELNNTFVDEEKKRTDEKSKEDVSQQESSSILPPEFKKECSTGELSDIQKRPGKRGCLDKSIELQLVRWIKNYQHPYSLSSREVCQKATQLFAPKYPKFKCSRGWYYNFVRRHNLKRG